MNRQAWINSGLLVSTTLLLSLLAALQVVASGRSTSDRVASDAHDIVLCANDGHTMRSNTGPVPTKEPKPDTLSLIDTAHYPPTILNTIEVPSSVVAPPVSAAITRDTKYAIVTSASKVDSHDANKLVPDDRVSVIDLQSSPPKIIQQTNAGAGASGVEISADGTLVMVANREEGTVSVFKFQDGRLDNAGKVDTGNVRSEPVAIVFIPGTNRALLTRCGDHMINVLRVDGTSVKLDARPITTGLKPLNIDITTDGKFAVVGNMGRISEDVATISLIDLRSEPYKTIQTISTPPGPEGLKFSPDGKFLAIAAQNGSNRPSTSPVHHDHGMIIVYAVTEKFPYLSKLAEAPAGAWTQGIAFSRDGRTILSQNMSDGALSIYRWHGGRLIAGQPLKMPGGPEALRTPW